MRYSNGVLHWEIQFCRELHNHELEAFRSFINSIYSTPIGESRRIRDIGCLVRGRGSRLVHTTISLLAIVSNFSLGKAFGSRRSPLEWLFLSRPQPWGNV